MSLLFGVNPLEILGVMSGSGPVVQQLLKAGALFVGKTNLDQFASGLAGDRSPYGACLNVFRASYISSGTFLRSSVNASGLPSFWYWLRLSNL